MRLFYKNVIKATFILFLLTLSSCGYNSRPKTKQLEDIISAEIPTFTSLEKIKFDFNEVSDNQIKANFKATVKAKEDLFAEIKDSKLDQLVIDKVNGEGKKSELYGYVVGTQRSKKWDLWTPVFESGLEHLGLPKGKFEPTIIVKNSQAYTDTLAEEELKKREIAKLEEKKRQAKQLRIEAAKAIFKKDAVFSGKLIWKNLSQPIQIKIASIVGSTYIVECSNPQQESVSQIFEGKIVDQAGESTKLVLNSRFPQQMGAEVWELYKRNTSLVLVPTEVGIDGNANTDHHRYKYQVVLRN